ncbi:MAG: peptide deformylase [Chloroflexi bacterium]|nr:peptide deformylase [Chloroflexota bacterium]MXV79581.1 peptide deformylase [Chloroflexota bacterium]MYC02267.1 peptide deformylase [Chloroflexota bacterium]
MAVHQITTLPRDAAVLRTPAKRVRKFDASLRALVADMIDSMNAAHGVGIAAPQIGIGLRVVVIGMPGERPFVMVNPEVVKRSGERELIEGCLSVPGYRGRVTRSTRVLAKAQDISGREIRVRAEDDLLAQCLEHEIDHINGRVYIDHVPSIDQLWTLDEMIADDDDEADEDDEVDEDVDEE